MIYRKPNGKHTTDEDEYVNSWAEMIQPTLDKTGLILSSFDPSFGLRTPDGRHTVILPVWFVEKLNSGND